IYWSCVRLESTDQRIDWSWLSLESTDQHIDWSWLSFESTDRCPTTARNGYPVRAAGTGWLIEIK
ncbi:MAG: hypothetical protein KDI79_05665, partial [Anaerolineae bacterium]|nr:hypothetical protein [Anaerolineae bacterium]